MFGFYNVNKSAGPTSHDIVDAVRRKVGPGIKVGHAGTLDPFAEGVLVICVGPAVRLAEYVQVQPKSYVTSIALGATSTTDDINGQITPTPDATEPSEQTIRQVLSGFIGLIDQVPPAHSAVHVNGERAYKAARLGQELRLPPRQVHVHRIDLLEYRWPEVRIDVGCGGGTYIRALARDAGKALGVGGYCSNLTRTQVGPYRLEEAVAIDDLNIHRDLLSPLTALHDMPKLAMQPEMIQRVTNGRTATAASAVKGPHVAIVDDAGRLVAIADVLKDSITLQPLKVFKPFDC